YTNFDYSEIRLDRTSIKKADQLKISVQVKNSGNFDGEEVIQLYIQDIVGSQTRPIKELKKFQKVFIEKGQSKDVEFVLSEVDLKFYNQNLEYISEPGKFKIFIGTNSR